MRKKLSESVQVGLPPDFLKRMSREELRTERKKAKFEEARFVRALEDRGAPPRVTTPRDADKAERLRYRRARQAKGARSLYRHLVSWRRYIRLLNALIKATSVTRDVVISAAAARREAQAQHLEAKRVARVLERRKLRMRKYRAVRNRQGQYDLAMEYFTAYRTMRQVSERDPYAQAFFLVALLELRDKLPKGTYRVSRHTDVPLEEARAALAAAQEGDPYK